MVEIVTVKMQWHGTLSSCHLLCVACGTAGQSVWHALITVLCICATAAQTGNFMGCLSPKHRSEFEAGVAGGNTGRRAKCIALLRLSLGEWQALIDCGDQHHAGQWHGLVD